MIQEHRIALAMTDREKTSCVMVLCQYAASYTTLHELANCLTVPGTPVLWTQQATLLVAIMAPYNRPLAERIDDAVAPFRVPAMPPDEFAAEEARLIARMQGDIVGPSILDSAAPPVPAVAFDAIRQQRNDLRQQLAAMTQCAEQAAMELAAVPVSAITYLMADITPVDDGDVQRLHESRAAILEWLEQQEVHP